MSKEIIHASGDPSDPLNSDMPEIQRRLLYATGDRAPGTVLEKALADPSCSPIYVEDAITPHVVALVAKYPKMHGQFLTLPPYGTPGERQRVVDLPIRVASKLNATALYLMQLLQTSDRLDVLFDRDREAIDLEFSGSQLLISGNGVPDHAHYVGYFSRHRQDPANLYQDVPADHMDREARTRQALALSANEIDRLDDLLERF